MCARQCSSAPAASPASISSSSRRCDRRPRRRVDNDPTASSVSAHRRDGADDDLVEHLGDDGEGLVPAEGDETLVERRVRDAEALGIFDRLPLPCRSSCSARRPRRDGRACDAIALAASGSMQRARFEHVGERHVACPQDERRGARGHALVRFVDDHPAVHAADDGDQTLGFEDAQRLAQRRTRHPESFDEVRLASERLAFRELAADDQRPQLVGDLLRLLAKASPVALARQPPEPSRVRRVETSGGYRTSPRDRVTSGANDLEVCRGRGDDVARQRQPRTPDTPPPNARAGRRHRRRRPVVGRGVRARRAPRRVRRTSPPRRDRVARRATGRRLDGRQPVAAVRRQPGLLGRHLARARIRGRPRPGAVLVRARAARSCRRSPRRAWRCSAR